MRFFKLNRVAAPSRQSRVMIEAIEPRVYFSTTVATTTTTSATVMSAVAVPAKPTGLIATAMSTSQISMRWNTVSGATGYTLERSLDGTTFSHVTNLTATTYTNSGLTANTKYIYRVKAYNAGGASIASNTSTATTLASTTTTAKTATVATTSTTTTTTTVKTAAVSTAVQPSAKNTGVPAGTVLKTVAPFKAASNTTYSNLRITGQMTVTGLTNIKFINCVLDASGGMYCVRSDYASNITISHCELVNATMAAVWGSGYTASDNYVHQCAGDAFKAGSNAVIQGNYVTALGWNAPSAHADGVQLAGGSNITISGNYFDLPINVASTKSNSALFLQGNTTNVTFANNWVRGGNYALHLFSDTVGGNATIKVTGNIYYALSARYGFAQMGSGVVWSGNTTSTGLVALSSTK
ncbi:hypothetical protein BH10PLA1_BH10PLA1_07570 [soil metagenome]